MTISSVSPVTGSVGGDLEITITGTGFPLVYEEGKITVKLNDVNA